MLIVYVIGETSGYNVRKRFVLHNWNRVEEPEVFYYEDGYYMVKFFSKDDM